MDSDVASTARITAAYRAIETARPDPLLNDPLAATFAGREVVTTLAAQPPEILARAAGYTIIRTRVFDDWLRSAADCPQVVLLGAGFGARAFRLGWPTGTHLWELDQAPLLDAKEDVLREVQASAQCTRHVVAADLVSAEFMAARNTYAADQGQRTAAPTSPVFHFSANDPGELLARHGWRTIAIRHPGDADCHFGRWVGTSSTGVGFSFVLAVRPGPGWRKNMNGPSQLPRR